MPIAADRFTITVSLILLRYTVVRTAVCGSVPQYTAVRFLLAVPNPSENPLKISVIGENEIDDTAYCYTYAVLGLIDTYLLTSVTNPLVCLQYLQTNFMVFDHCRGKMSKPTNTY